MILLTGATGLVGGEIANQLAGKGLPFKALRRSSGKVNPILKTSPLWVDGDIMDPMSLKEALKDVDTVIHSAALISFYRREYKTMHQVNVNGTANLINEAIAANVKKFIHISSVAALGRSQQEKHIDETARWVNSPDNSAYGESKHLAELEVWRGQEEGLAVGIINPSVVLGPGNWHQSSTKLFRYAWKEGKFYPPGTFNYVDLRDVSHAVLQVMATDIQGDRFIVSNDTIYYKDFFEKVAEHFDKKAPQRKLTRFIAQMAVIAEGIKSTITGSPPLITRESINLSGMKYRFDNAKIKRVLGFEFTPLSDTIAWTCRELKSRYT